jgi:hypothetical protein
MMDVQTDMPMGPGKTEGKRRKEKEGSDEKRLQYKCYNEQPCHFPVV